MKLKWYKDSSSFCADLERIGWFSGMDEGLVQKLMKCILESEVDPRNYFTIPFLCLGHYVDLEDGSGIDGHAAGQSGCKAKARSAA